MVQSVQFSTVAQSCPTLCDPMDCSTPGLTVHHQLLDFSQTHVHWVSDAIQPSHPLLSPSPPTFNLSQHQGLSKWVSSSHQVAELLEFRFNISPSNEYSGLISFRMDWYRINRTTIYTQNGWEPHVILALIILIISCIILNDRIAQECLSYIDFYFLLITSLIIRMCSDFKCFFSIVLKPGFFFKKREKRWQRSSTE